VPRQRTLDYFGLAGMNGGIQFDAHCWTGGYGTEALKLWIHHLFASMPLVRIGFATWSGNHRMIRCSEKLGMRMEARIRKARLYDGKYYDSIRMGVLREEWDEVHVNVRVLQEPSQ
jgi:RimJ/RimL family protein N-acetyltransferase